MGLHIAAGTEAADMAADTGVVETEVAEIEVGYSSNQNVDHNRRNNFQFLFHAHSYCTVPYCPLDVRLYLKKLQLDLAERQDSQMLEATATKQQELKSLVVVAPKPNGPWSLTKRSKQEKAVLLAAPEMPLEDPI